MKEYKRVLEVMAREKAGQGGQRQDLENTFLLAFSEAKHARFICNSDEVLKKFWTVYHFNVDGRTGDDMDSEVQGHCKHF